MRTLDPGFFAAETQYEAVREAPDIACLVGYTLLRTGDEALGRSLIEQAMTYGTVELPKYVRHAPQVINLHHCHAIRGDFEAALAVMESFLAHGHYDAWREPRLLEYFQPLHGDSRFEALMQRVEDEMARQRANLAQLEAGA